MRWFPDGMLCHATQEEFSQYIPLLLSKGYLQKKSGIWSETRDRCLIEFAHFGVLINPSMIPEMGLDPNTIPFMTAKEFWRL